jgi:hypothetical protein
MADILYYSPICKDLADPDGAGRQDNHILLSVRRVREVYDGAFGQKVRVGIVLKNATSDLRRRVVGVFGGVSGSQHAVLRRNNAFARVRLWARRAFVREYLKRWGQVEKRDVKRTAARTSQWH